MRLVSRRWLKVATMAVVVLGLCAAALTTEAAKPKKARREGEPFPNWMGEVNLNLENGEGGEEVVSDAAGGGEAQKKKHVLDPDEVPGPSGSITKKLVAWKPRLFHLSGIVSPEEAQYAVALAENNLDSFDVLDPLYEPQGIVTHWSIPVFDDDLVYNIVRRVSTITMLPVENFADVEIYRFGDSDSFLDVHTDILPGIKREDPGLLQRDPARKDPGQRVARVMVNIDPGSSMGFVFPRAQKMYDAQEEFNMGDPANKCRGAVGAELKPTETLLYHTMDTKGDVERYYGDYKTCTRDEAGSSFHSNVGWLMVLSINAYSHNKCKDDNASCEAWADSGECKNNPKYMFEQCKRSCGKC
ncbi:ShKT domain-containing protein [Chloropicon primus]|nr:hypothetical protein A3770_09p56270 [Chloropicon primus]UPR02323.1 ShKT domain-containing protein [Chloropicon primus]|eukprot:QDZ23109.1 hypothetical protein A3770_09p56270 [Chloropicon primus]